MCIIMYVNISIHRCSGPLYMIQMSLCVAYLSNWLPLLVCFPAPVCVAASQQDAGDRAAGQSQQPRPQHLQWLWWWRPWARGNLWPSQVLAFKTPLSLQTGQQRGDHVLAGSHFLPFTSCPSLSSFAHWIPSSSTTVHPPRPQSLFSPAHVTHLSALSFPFSLCPFLSYRLCPLSISLFSFLLPTFFLFPPLFLLVALLLFSLPFHSHSSSLPFFLLSSYLHPPSSTSSSV